MIANYGYTDGSGEYYISINTDLCLGCLDHSCVPACPSHIFEIVPNDYDEITASVKEDSRKNLKYVCAPCKPVNRVGLLPCESGCAPGAIKHTW